MVAKYCGHGPLTSVLGARGTQTQHVCVPEWSHTLWLQCEDFRKLSRLSISNNVLLLSAWQQMHQIQTIIKFEVSTIIQPNVTVIWFNEIIGLSLNINFHSQYFLTRLQTIKLRHQTKTIIFGCHKYFQLLKTSCFLQYPEFFMK